MFSFDVNYNIVYFRLKFKPIKKRDNGTYYCNVNRSENETMESFWYNITINIQSRIYKVKPSIPKPTLQIMNSKTDVDVEDHRERRFLPENQFSINHVVKLSGENFTMSCPYSRSTYD